MTTINFNGVDPSSVLGAGNFTINKIKGRGPVSRDLTLLTVPGRDGAYLQQARTPERSLEVAITLRATDTSDLRTQVDLLNDLFVTDEEVPIVFSDEDRIYYGVLADSTDWEEIRNFGQGTLKFICPDPFKYGEELVTNFTGDSANVKTNGNEAADPVFTFNIKQDTTVLMAADSEGNYMAIGKPYDLDQTPYSRETVIMNDSCTSLVGWTSGTAVDRGVVAGQMTVSPNGQDFVASSYGTGTQWHGPAVVQGLTEPLQDFRAEFYLNLFAHEDPRTIGRVEMYLLDVNGNVVATLGMRNAWRQNNHNIAKVVLGSHTGGHFMIDTKGKTPIWWNKFTGGVFRLQRIGNEFFAYVANRTSAGEHFRAWWTGYTDLAGAYQAPIAQVQLHIGAYGTDPVPTTMGIQAVRVWRINPKQTNQVPYIAKAGDTVVFDHAKRDIRINGESRLDAKDFGGRFFQLKPGVTSLAVAPVGVSDTSVRWRDKYR